MIRNLRWYIVGLLTLVAAINYLDRNVLSVAQVVLEKELGITGKDYGHIVAVFLVAYGLVHPLAGRLIDWLGSRIGLTVAFIVWSLASVGHALAGGVYSFAAFRFLLGAGESGNFPASIKTVGEWFPAKERALATGIINVGTGVGALLAPPLAGGIIFYCGWRAAFILTGVTGMIWLIPWLILGRRPEEHKRITPEELAFIQAGQQEPATAVPKQAAKGVWREALSRSDMWAMMLARLLTDPVWLFFSFWIPKYFKDARGFDLKDIALFTWLPFLASGIGSVTGGWISSAFIGRGLPVITGRKISICISAAMMPLTILSVYAQSWQLAMACLSVAAFGHQSWAASILTLPADLFPKRMIASCYGLPAMMGVLGGAFTQWYVGGVIEAVGYAPVFLVAGCMHPLAATVMLLFVKSNRTGLSTQGVEIAASACQR